MRAARSTHARSGRSKDTARAYEQVAATARAANCTGRLRLLVPFWSSSRSFAGFGFFHRLLDFLGSLGPGFGALLPLFIEQLFTAEQLDERLIGTVPLLPGGAHDAQVAAVTVAKAWSNRIEEFVDRGLAHQVG